MKRDYEKKYEIGYSETNQNLELRVYEAFNLLQNAVTEYFESFEEDNITVRKKYNAAWVVTKAKAHFNRRPVWRENIKSRTYTTKVKPIRVEVETAFKDINDEILFVVSQESCAIDLTTRKIRKLNTISYPEDMEEEKATMSSNYEKLRDEFKDEDFAYEHIVQVADVDYTRHTNNAIYVRIIMNGLSCDFFDKNRITDFEIHYINESKEGQTLKIYKKEEDNIIKFLIRNDEKEVARCSLAFEKKKI